MYWKYEKRKEAGNGPIKKQLNLIIAYEKDNLKISL